MTKVFFDSAISLDGYFAGDNRGPNNQMGGVSPLIHSWMFKQHAFWNHLGVDRGEKGTADGALIQKTFDRTGAVIMGKRMFEEGMVSWPEDLFKCPVYVLTHEVREPMVQKGSTTFHFINDGIESALEKALANAGGKDVRINGGADTIQQYLNAGLVDEFDVHTSPVILGSGIRLFDGLDKKMKLEVVNVIHSPETTHAYYQVIK